MHSLATYKSGVGWSPASATATDLGQKALGLSAVPEAWRAPLAVLTSEFYVDWLRAQENQKKSEITQRATELIEQHARDWSDQWPRGIILRSSASSETMEDRGAFCSLRLAGDFDREQINASIGKIYSEFSRCKAESQIAVLVQPLVKEGVLGHLSNERRVSKTIKQWRWEIASPTFQYDKVNSWRDAPPDEKLPLRLAAYKSRDRLFGSIGSWVNVLKRGPAHIEWAIDGEKLWILQIDFEMEMPDVGVDPTAWLRDADLRPSGILAKPLHFKPVALSEEPSPWRKIENIRVFKELRSELFPPLLSMTGDTFEACRGREKALSKDLEDFGHGRVVCRTDCRAAGVPRENLPRTHTVNSSAALAEMAVFLELLKAKGSPSKDVNFILHKFIPAHVGAWVKAEPGNQIVIINSLWGLPDGLQYLPYDTFEFDIRKNAMTAERLRYKPQFIQEDSNGNWVKLRVRRTLARARTLSKSEVADIAQASHAIARHIEKPVLIMWFCGIPKQLDIGANLPWFRMSPHQTAVNSTATPQWRRTKLRTVAEIELAEGENLRQTVLLLDPEVDLIREDSEFLRRVIKLAKEKELPVEISGSTLAHAFYLLEKEGVAVFPADETNRSRVRSRKSFDKLVRDEVPQQIMGQGEIVIQSRLAKTELRHALVAKLLEEGQELLAAVDPDDVKGELADLLEVVRSMATATGVEWQDVSKAADEKRSRRGGFDAGAVLVETAWPSPNRTATRAPTTVSLKNLGQVWKSETGTTVSFNALLADHQSGVDVEIDGHKLKVQMVANGLKVTECSKSSATPKQLELPLNMPGIGLDTAS